MVNGLEPEVGHTYVVGIGIDQGNPDPSFSGLPDGSFLLTEEAVYFVEEFFGHERIISRAKGDFILSGWHSKQ